MRGTLTRRGAARLGIAVALALAVVTACAPTPEGPPPAPTTEHYGGIDFEYRAAVPYASYKETKYDLWLPQTGVAPLVVFVHGGFWATQSENGDRKTLPDQVKALLLHGYAVASIDYRGVLQNCTQLQILGDVKAAIGDIVYINANGRVDPANVNLVGFSAGGHLSMMAGMTYHSPSHPANGVEARIRTVTSIAGPSDLESLYAFAQSTGNLPGTIALDQLGGGFHPNNAQYSPISQTATDEGLTDPPLYLIYSTDDELVPYAQATAMVAAANAAGIDVTLSPRSGIAHDPMRLQVDTNALVAWLAAH